MTNTQKVQKGRAGLNKDGDVIQDTKRGAGRVAAEGAARGLMTVKPAFTMKDHHQWAARLQYRISHRSLGTNPAEGHFIPTRRYPQLPAPHRPAVLPRDSGLFFAIASPFRDLHGEQRGASYWFLVPLLVPQPFTSS